MKKIMLQDIAKVTMAATDTVEAELEDMRKTGEILGTYVAEGCFLAYSKDEENSIAKEILGQGISIANLSERFNLSREEAFKLLEKILKVRRIGGLFTNDEAFYHSYQSLAKKLTEMLSQ